MSNWCADRELEVACKVGSIRDVERAMAEGGDVNCDGGSPLFLSVMAGNREMVEFLVEKGATPSAFLPDKTLKKLQSPEEIVEALMACSPPPLTEDEKKEDGKELMKDEEKPAHIPEPDDDEED